MKVIKYGTPWCNQCKVMSETLKRSGIPYEEIDVDEHEEIAEKKNIRSVPLLEICDDLGNVLFSKTGIIPMDELKELVNRYEQ